MTLTKSFPLFLNLRTFCLQICPVHTSALLSLYFHLISIFKSQGTRTFPYSCTSSTGTLWHQKVRPLICHLLCLQLSAKKNQQEKPHKLHWSFWCCQLLFRICVYSVLRLFIYLTEKYVLGCWLTVRHVKTHSETSSVRAVNTSTDNTAG